MTFNGIVACAAVFIFLVLVTVVKAIDSGRLSGSRNILVLFSPLAGTIIIIMSGLLIRNQPAMMFLPYLGLGVVLALAIFSVYRLRHLWIIAVLVALTINLASLWCWFLAGMAITDNWL